MSAFRGFISQAPFPIVIEPHLSDGKFSTSDIILPSSCDYNLNDLISAGVKLSPVDTSLLHDDDAINQVISSDVEPSNVSE